MHGSTVLVTGGTGGIGLATATGLAGLGARVGIVGRSAARGAVAADAVRRKVPSAEVDLFEADMSSQAEVRRLAAEVRATYPRLDVLVNNVGGYWAHRHVTTRSRSTTSPPSCSPTSFSTCWWPVHRRGS